MYNILFLNNIGPTVHNENGFTIYSHKEMKAQQNKLEALVSIDCVQTIQLNAMILLLL